MNPRRLVVEDRALSLADALESAGHALLAASLREVVPETYGLADEHLPMLKDRLREVSRTGPEFAAAAHRILAALEDLPAFIGVRGTVWARWESDGFAAHWEEEDWLEAAPSGPALGLDAVLAWANRRADRILLMPEWDRDRYYSAGRTLDPEHPQLER